MAHTAYVWIFFFLRLLFGWRVWQGRRSEGEVNNFCCPLSLKLTIKKFFLYFSFFFLTLTFLIFIYSTFFLSHNFQTKPQFLGVQFDPFIRSVLAFKAKIYTEPNNPYKLNSKTEKNKSKKTKLIRFSLSVRFSPPLPTTTVLAFYLRIDYWDSGTNSLHYFAATTL